VLTRFHRNVGLVGRSILLSAGEDSVGDDAGGGMLVLNVRVSDQLLVEDANVALTLQ
jgi:hypothetical protein